jgi:hypothetical protein
MLRRRIALKSSVFLFLSGCATILQPGPDSIPIRTVPPGATVLLNGYLKGVTPLNIEVERDNRCSLEIYKSGYQTVYLDKDKVVAGWVFGNIIFGGIPGLVIDLALHNQGKYSEDPVTITLQPSKNTKKRI